MNIKFKTGNYLVRNTIIDNFVREINKYPIMSAQEEKDAFIKIEESQKRIDAAKDTPEYNQVKAVEDKIQLDIRNEIITRHQRFNFAIAKRYDNGELVMDLVNVGAIGMYEAFEKFDYKNGVRFCTFAVWYIRRAINAYINKENLLIRTTNDSKLLCKVKNIENEFFANEGRMPTDSEIVDKLKNKYNIKNIDLTDLHRAITASIDIPTEDEDSSVNGKNLQKYNISTASYNEYESQMVNDDLADSLKRMMAAIPERERTIICMYAGYGYDKEYKDHEIADILEMSSERVRQLRHSAQKKLQAMAARAF